MILRDNKGSALLELALTAPLLMFMTIGAAELGRICYIAIEVTGAARAGADYGAQNVSIAFAPAAIANIEQAAENEVPNLTLTFPAPPTQECVCETVNTDGTVSYSTGSGSGNSSPSPVPCYSNGSLVQEFKTCNAVTSTSQQQVVEYVQVQPQATVKTMFHYPGIPASFTLSGTAEMRVLQN